VHSPATPANPAADAADPLQRERDHLASSRAALRAMREDAESLDISDVAGSWVTQQVLHNQIQRRIAALADLAHTPLFFGRLDFLHAIATEASEGAGGERFYIGRRHVHDAEGDPMVIDWRAPVSQSFYRASRKDPMDIGKRRRFGYTGGELTAYEDENLSDPAETEQASALLAAEIEKPRVGPMRDIVATIQPEQDEIVRADVGGTVCVQGAPGTGKTAVGLHRVAYLLYAHRERLAKAGTLVIGPNSSFLSYIEQVLPALGELDVAQATVQELVAHVEVRGTDTAEAARIKGDARLAEVLRRAVRAGITLPTEPCVVTRGSRRWRVPAYELVEIIEELAGREVRYGAAMEALPQRIAHAVLLKMEQAGEAPDDRVQDAVARSREVKAAVKACWPPVDPAKLVLRLLGDAEFLARCAEGVLSEAEQAAILWAKPGRSARTAPWSAADAVLVDEARDLVQGTTPWATASWPEALHHLGKQGAHVEELTTGFRVPEQVIAYASRLLPSIAPGLAPATSIRTGQDSLTIRHAPDDGLTGAVLAACRAALELEGSTGLIAADARIPLFEAALAEAGLPFLTPGTETTAEARLTLVPASLAKGLEYDYVVLDEPAAVVAGEPDERTGLRRLYVALTRAVSGLTVLHSQPLPEQLG
jgi:DNA helicase IV